MDVEIGPGSPAIALSAFQQANPRAMYLPANTVAAAAAGISLPPVSISNYPNPNSNASHYYYHSNSNFTQQPRQYQHHNQHYTLDVGGGMRKMRKRKAESQDNERLSKRLSLLNLEKNGNKLYVPVESPKLRPTECALTQIPEDDTMQLDDSKHKVYIYNLDDELSESESDGEGRLVFIPDIEKHLMQNRIPPSVLANSDGELAGMQMVLYSEPSSLTVPKEQDSVRKAIIEARQRVREKQKEEREQETSSTPIPANSHSMSNGIPNEISNGFANHNGVEAIYNDDPDAMEVD
ncbi:uncharacterized protein GGS22DRAFT_58131 [Annulohypoxylon maeteangense]|uniref:uncharacterized protein n=1 Tax=Annulohypoxylon maeteangense TaxID=1927788 RepID=UPI0020078AD5|nr:uncharacterized protein GGS22DRAFT_58131 [Annulohypoxylon maeteangense]KAI0881442.1 hypothetical protein GGS22DRAFT_58131 [Annulohypoxylon maeteangense]